MFIYETGEGLRGVVGFHGWSGDHRTFALLWERMPEGWTFFSFDLPGCGASERPAEWNFRAMAREVATEVIQLGMRDLVLVGSCSGAILTAFVTRELREMGRPEVVGRLVMVEPFAYCPWYLRLLLLPGIGPLMYASAFANPLGRWITDRCLQGKKAEGTDLMASFEEADHWVCWRYLKMLHECGRPGQFRGLKVPVEILYGERTFSAVRRSVQEWKEALPQARVTEIKGISHLPISECATGVAKILFAEKAGAEARK